MTPRNYRDVQEFLNVIVMQSNFQFPLTFPFKHFLLSVSCDFVSQLSNGQGFWRNLHKLDNHHNPFTPLVGRTSFSFIGFSNFMSSTHISVYPAFFPSYMKRNKIS